MTQAQHRVLSRFARWAVLIVLLFACTPRASAESELPSRIEMSVGDSRTLQVRSHRVVLGNSRLLSVVRSGADQLLLVGQAAGVTALRIWDAQDVQHRILVTVAPVDVEHVREQLSEILKSLPGVSVRVAGDKVLLEGAMSDAGARERIGQIAALYPGSIVNLVGKAGWEQTVVMDVRIVELRKLSWRDVGLRWQEDIAGPRVATATNFGGDARLRSTDGLVGIPAARLEQLGAQSPAASIYFGIASSLDARLRLLEQNGDAALLAEPVLSCRSGGSAHFVSGGEIPLPVVNGLGSSNVEFKEYGVILDLQPIVDPNGGIFAKIETELSQLDPSQAVLGVPALLKRRSVTEINLRAGETLVIAGLTLRSAARGTQGLPGLASRRHGSALFGERTRREERTELAIFITAQVMQAQPTDPPAADASALERARKLAEQAAHE